MRIEELHDLFDREKVGEIAFDGTCHDCKKKILVVITMQKEGFAITDGAVYKIENTEEYKGENTYILKCPDCYEKNPILENYQECEVYSRVVGYFRPVKQWNPGKVREFNDRKMFNIDIEQFNKVKWEVPIVTVDDLNNY